MLLFINVWKSQTNSENTCLNVGFPQILLPYSIFEYFVVVSYVFALNIFLCENIWPGAVMGFRRQILALWGALDWKAKAEGGEPFWVRSKDHLLSIFNRYESFCKGVLFRITPNWRKKTITVILWTKLKVVGRTRKTRLAWSNKIGYFQ